ncbi:hypothetical protein [Citrobacter portucalensis]|uniref:hypothetical protein n=1 Tax=Citrobacter portucalensis TaxID=1639133 RepID=UPI003A854630
MKTETIIEKVIDAGLSVFEHENNGDFGDDVMHLTIVGGVRRVEFYPTTETVYANAVKGKFPVFKQKNAGIKVAIRIAKSGV